MDIADSVICKPLECIIEFCTECDALTPFVDTLKCFYCGCDSPFGSFYDFEINEMDMYNYIMKNTISFGLINENTENIILEMIEDIKQMCKYK